MSFTIRRATPDDDFNTIVGMLYDTKAFQLPFKFATRDEAISLLTKLTVLKETEYSYHRMILCLDNDKIVGVLQGYIPSHIDKRKALIEYRSVLKDSKFKGNYFAWRKYSAPISHLDTSIFVYNIGIDREYYYKNVINSLLNSFQDIALENNRPSILMDIKRSEEEKIAILRGCGFEPIRLIYTKPYDEPYLRMHHDVNSYKKSPASLSNSLSI